ncbi:endo-1,3(4)-beta-glucanase 2-like [Neltuma alba]|uniref:endo-1,3(4)-beta-glucanase 2-like n=1 Tax=Neltuma alba TaxID=207710 RepID=UPI0010A5367A|nr:endo-1,3(4)-beta-glucanase 2-like [Prosopis alba]XP_028769479.1 endo-1,3(4)-beta-glucanase 2-like [Prosopis alba]XP_028784422.1 endo-1,3(4)-beta-glucanase 2-like [Prosopis alba]
MASPFLFPLTQSTVMPDPSSFFSPNLLSSPLPTNSFFQNFVLNNGDQHEYFHPYLVKSANSSLSLSYPLMFFSTALLYQVFVPDLTISSKSNSRYSSSNISHVVSSYSDLSVTLELPSSNLRFFLVKGSPFVTAEVTRRTSLSISTVHGIVSLSSGDSLMKHTIRLDNNQTWLIYASSPVRFRRTSSSEITSDKGFYGIIRIAALPDSENPKSEKTLDQFSSCYPVSGDAALKKPYRVEYKFQNRRSGALLMLAHPLHLRLLSDKESDCTIIHDFKYRSIDGDLVGVVGASWVLKINPIPVTWHSTKGIKQDSSKEIISALVKDVNDLNPSNISTNSSYYYGKRVARAARLALIAEEVSYPEVIPKVKNFLKQSIEPWLYGTFKGNGFLYEKEWKGLVTKQGSTSTSADFGFGIYNDHHYHIGYFIYGMAVLAKIDPDWGEKHKPQAYSLVEDYFNLGGKSNSNPYYTRLRCFDLYSLHSWAAGLTEFEHGRNQESTSEAVNAYYAAALMGLVYEDSDLMATGSTLTALEILAAQTWWHVEESNKMYEEEFVKENRIVGILWSNKRDSALWWASADCRSCRLLIQVLPITPITEVLFSNVGYTKELVEWTEPELKNAEESRKGFAFALEGIYDQENALKKIRKLKGFDDGNSLTNLLWWVHSRGNGNLYKY